MKSYTIDELREFYAQAIEQESALVRPKGVYYTSTFFEWLEQFTLQPTTENVSPNTEKTELEETEFARVTKELRSRMVQPNELSDQDMQALEDKMQRASRTTEIKRIPIEQNHNYAQFKKINELVDAVNTLVQRMEDTHR